MKYDVIIVGGCTAGLYFAKRMAELGYKVLVTDKLSKDNCGKRLDIFHMNADDFERYNAPKPNEGDKDFVRKFNFSASRSALGRWEKYHEHTVFVMKLPLYIKRLTSWAAEYGVDFSYGTEFKSFSFDGKGKICGADFIKNGKPITYEARLVADCSGIAAAARTMLPYGYGSANFPITDRDRFYVSLRYIRFKHPEKVHIRHTISWPYYKVWIAPQEDANGAILGVGANMSFDYAERCLRRFLKNISIPEYEIIRTERGVTPYCKPPYSFVADGFVSIGDSACITKPDNGEGVTAAWNLADIAAEEIGIAMKNGNYPTAQDMWGVNVRYQTHQGAEFAQLLAVMTGAVDCTPEENDYEFQHNVIFRSKLKKHPSDKKEETGELIAGLMNGVTSGNIRLKTINKLLRYSSIASQIKSHYKAFPDNISDFDEWAEDADELWAQAGSMSDVVYSSDYYLNDL